MATTLLETFRALASFHPPKTSLADAPWDEYVDWSIANGLAPMAAYNLEYALAGGGAPEWVRDRLLSVYQGTLNDNVMKLVNFKRAIASLEGRKVVLLGAASFAEALYPHVAFRPVEDLHLWVAPKEESGLAGFLRDSEFKPAASEGEVKARGTLIVSDGRTRVFIHGSLIDGGIQDREMFARALPFRAFGPSLFRLDLEDAILALCSEHARNGYSFADISWVDLRELLLGAPELGGPYSRPPLFEVLLARAKAMKLEAALYTSTAVVERLFPHTAAVVAQARPSLRRTFRALLDRFVVGPSTELGKMRVTRGASRLRRLLAGGSS